MNKQELKELRNLNIDLLKANLEMMRYVKEYCNGHSLPSPVLDRGFSYRVRQLLDLCADINETLGIPASTEVEQYFESTEDETEPFRDSDD